MYQRRLECIFRSKVLWTALSVFLMHLGGNRRWVPPTFENNNNNKRYCAHKFYFTISSAVSSIRLHSRGQILPFSWGKILFLPHRFGQHIVEQEVESGKNCLFN